MANTTPIDRANAKIAMLINKIQDPATPDLDAQLNIALAAELSERATVAVATQRAKAGRRPENLVDWDFEVTGQGHHGKGRAAIPFRMAQALGCQPIHLDNVLDSTPRTVRIVGPASTIAFMKLLFPVLMAEAERRGEAATEMYMKTTGKDIPKEKSQRGRARRDFFRSYLKGFGLGTAIKTAQALRALDESLAGKASAGIMKSDRDRIATAFKKRFPECRTLSADTLHEDGFEAGLQGSNPKLVTSDERTPAKK
ncbi:MULTISPECIES: hypothetical protein [unclassified Crossiella]|uniref:hypothetical protein n=1 Tax=unclassified Crossiella TaxID=2620835 RepID=UPI001FFE40D1|nr:MULTISPECIES: hypothetical protein [unclassified Crossiella]MCK2237721.1 hypothetical protein [Crossiella sp. S99.2]MCK2255007.1 hypothetical protein [Crossiella sp. S99.1]